jgi:hypothetical protein
MIFHLFLISFSFSSTYMVIDDGYIIKIFITTLRFTRNSFIGCFMRNSFISVQLVWH